MEILPDEADVLDQKWYGFAAQSPIAEGQNGEIWFVYGGYLFRYKQETGISLEIAGIDHNINISGRSIVVTDQNDIWFVAEILVEGPEFFNGLYRKGQSVIFRFNPESETLQDFGSPPGYPRPRSSFHPFSLYMNSRGQLWADDLGWLERTQLAGMMSRTGSLLLSLPYSYRIAPVAHFSTLGSLQLLRESRIARCGLLLELESAN
jgi:hypothetical protein